MKFIITATHLLFDEEVYYHLRNIFYIAKRPSDVGRGRILHHENLYGLVASERTGSDGIPRFS